MESLDIYPTNGIPLDRFVGTTVVVTDFYDRRFKGRVALIKDGVMLEHDDGDVTVVGWNHVKQIRWPASGLVRDCYYDPPLTRHSVPS